MLKRIFLVQFVFIFTQILDLMKQAFVGAKIYPIEIDPIENGTIIVETIFFLEKTELALGFLLQCYRFDN